MILLAGSHRAAGQFLASHELNFRVVRVVYQPQHLRGLDLAGRAVLSVRGPGWSSDLEAIARAHGAAVWVVDPPLVYAAPEAQAP